jgi:adenylate kinase
MIVVLGVAGSGKSTQSQLLAASDHLQWLSIGVLLREKITDNRREQMLAGKMLDDIEVISYLEQAFAEKGDTPELILDGFPRSVYQADWLMDQSDKGALHISAVVHLELTKETAKARLLERGRPDDREDAIKERFNEYEHTIKPILSTLKDRGVAIVSVDANNDEQIVQEAVVKGLREAGVKV